MNEGHTKLSGWQQINKSDFVSDFIDACNVVYQCVTLEISN